MYRLKLASVVLLATLSGCPGSSGPGQNGNAPNNSNAPGANTNNSNAGSPTSTLGVGGQCIVTCTTDRVRTEAINKHDSFHPKQLLEKDKDSRGNFVFSPGPSLGCADYEPSETDCKVLVKNY